MTETNTPSKLNFWSQLKTFGIPAMVVTLIGMIAMLVGTLSLINRANQRVGDLMAKIGQSEERANQMEKRATEAEAVITRLQKLKPDELKSALDMLERSDLKALLKAGDYDQRLTSIAQQVGTIYFLADWNAHDTQTLHPNYLRNGLAFIFRTMPKLGDQMYTGKVAERIWIGDKSDESWMNMVKAQAISKDANDHLRETILRGRELDNVYDVEIDQAKARLLQEEAFKEWEERQPFVTVRKPGVK